MSSCGPHELHKQLQGSRWQEEMPRPHPAYDRPYCLGCTNALNEVNDEHDCEQNLKAIPPLLQFCIR
jgi:hypothetical protein